MILGKMLELLLNNFNGATIPLFEQSLTNTSTINQEIKNLLDENLVESQADNIDVILAADIKFKVAFKLLITVLAQSKYTYKSQSSVLLRIFADLIVEV
jgi:hypothetical protein